MAAGMSLDVERLAEFRLALSRAIQAQGEIPEPSLQIDAYLDLSELSLELAADLERLAPFGAGNPTSGIRAERHAPERSHDGGQG